jgi:hypothetical protein
MEKRQGARLALIYHYTFSSNVNSDDVVVGSGRVAACDREDVHRAGYRSSCAVICINSLNSGPLDLVQRDFI